MGVGAVSVFVAAIWIIGSISVSNDLIYHAEIGDLERVNLLLGQDGIDVNRIRTSKGYSALMIAACNGHIHVVAALLAFPATKVNLVGTNGDTALRLAVQKGHLDIVTTLLDHNDTDVNRVDMMGYSALMLSIREKLNTGMTKALIAHHGSLVNLASLNSGYSALHLCALWGNANLIGALLAHPDIAVNQVMMNGFGALLVAVNSGHVDAVRILLADHRVDVNLISNAGETALTIATLNNHVEIVEALLAHPEIVMRMEGDSPLIWAVKENHLQIVKAVLAIDAVDVLNYRGRLGKTALHIAVSTGNIDMINLLLVQQHINLTIVDDEGKAAMAYSPAGAIDLSAMRIALLLDNADLNAFNADGFTILHIAVINDDIEMVRALLEKCPLSAHQLTRAGRSSLHLVNDIDIARLLVAHHINTNTVDNDDDTALHWAVKSHKVDIVRYLVSAEFGGVAVNYGDRHGKTALHIAVERGDIVVVNLLLPQSDQEIRDDDGKTAETIAIEMNFSAIRDALRRASSGDQLNDDGLSLLHIAVLHGDIGTVRALLEKGPLSVHQLTLEGRSSLHLVNDIDIARLLVAHHINVNIMDNEYDSALHSAVKDDKTHIVRYLLSSSTGGIGVNYGDRYGRTALHNAVIRGNIDMVTALLAHPHIDITLLDDDLKTVNAVAIEMGNPVMINRLSEAMLSMANCAPNLMMIDDLVSAGLNVQLWSTLVQFKVVLSLLYGEVIHQELMEMSRAQLKMKLAKAYLKSHPDKNGHLTDVQKATRSELFIALNNSKERLCLTAGARLKLILSCR